MDVVGVRKNNSWLVEFVEDFIFEGVLGALRGRRINISYIFWESQKSGECTLDRTSQWPTYTKPQEWLLRCSQPFMPPWRNDMDMTNQNRITSNIKVQGQVMKELPGRQKKKPCHHPADPWIECLICVGCFFMVRAQVRHEVVLGSTHEVSTACFYMFQKSSIGCQSFHRSFMKFL